MQCVASQAVVVHTLCKGPGAGSCLVCWEEERVAQVAGAEQVRERVSGR